MRAKHPGKKTTREETQSFLKHTTWGTVEAGQRRKRDTTFFFS